jgi:hypothetical protein
MNVPSVDRISGVFVLAASLLAGTAHAQTDIARRSDQSRPTLQLTLDDAVRRAVDNNPDVFNHVRTIQQRESAFKSLSGRQQR